MIPDKIQSGFGQIDSPAISPDEQDTIQTRLISLVVLMVEYSLTNAMTFAIHHDVEEVNDETMTRALKVEAMQFFERADLETELESVIDTMMSETILHGMGSDGETDDDVADADGDDVVDDDVDDDTSYRLDEMIEIPRDELPERVDADDGTCRCNTCRRFHTIDPDWDAWDVADDPIKSFLQQHINALSQRQEAA